MNIEGFRRRARPRVLAGIDGATAVLARARRRLQPAAQTTAPDGYGSLWRPVDETEARALILNEVDPEVFERTGRGDAERMAPLFGPADTVLDLGCGIGRVARYVAPGCRRLWAVDASETMLALARGRLADHANVTFTRCAGTTIPDVPGGAVDFAYSLITLQHLEREDAFALLRDLRRVLRPGGRAYLTFPNLLSDEYLAAFRAYADEGHVTNAARARFYTPEEVRRLLPAAGFAVDTLEAGVEIVVTCS